jgi:uncharacterized protein YqjF (DUF2071 family)
MSRFRRQANPGITTENQRRFMTPPSGWIMRQSWHDLLFAHWRVSRDRLRALLPPGMELDTFDNDAWVGVIPFHMSIAPRAVPAIPWISSFGELNVRTYVRVDGVSGVYFFSLDANSIIAVTGGRSMFHLPYYFAAITHADHMGGFDFRSERLFGRSARFTGQYRATSDTFQAAPGTLEYWLTERYWLFTCDSHQRMYRVRVAHEPWQLQNATAEISQNTMAEAAGIALASMPPLCHYARLQPDVLTWPPEAVG